MQGSPRGLAFFALCLLPLAAQCVRLPGLGGQPCPDLRVGSVTRDSKGGWAFSSSAAGAAAAAVCAPVVGFGSDMPFAPLLDSLFCEMSPLL